jgi:hypothetical protein
MSDVALKDVVLRLDRLEEKDRRDNRRAQDPAACSEEF